MENLKKCTNDDNYKLALLRFSIIAPAINHSHAFDSQMAFFRDASLKQYVLPSGQSCYFKFTTIRDWYFNYKHYGFDSLIPKTRSDSGSSRKLPANVASKISEIKQQMPHITGKAIYNKLIEDGTILAKDFSIATVYRYLNNHNLKYIPTTEQKQFEMEYSNDCWQADTSHRSNY